MKNVNKEQTRELRKQLRAAEMNRTSEFHDYNMLEQACCQKHREIYDKHFERIDEDIIKAKGINIDSVTNKSVSVSHTSKSLLNSETLSDIEEEEHKQGILRKTLYISPQMRLAKQMMEDKKN